ncbi:MAG: hypothetical protein U0736_08770 [Gemmataceae bacterium]
MNISRTRSAANFPDRPEFRHGLASSHYNRGVLFSNTGRLKEAEREYDQAAIHQQLAADFPHPPRLPPGTGLRLNNEAFC